MALTLDRVDHVHVFVSDRAAAEKWYARVLFLGRLPELAFWASDGGPLTLGNSAGSVHLALFERPSMPCRSTIALAVGAAEFLEWREHLTQVLGGPVEVQDHTVSWSLYFADPDGNPFEITSSEYAELASHQRAGGSPSLKRASTGKQILDP